MLLGVDAIRLYKLKTANKQVQRIIRDRSPVPVNGSSNSAVIRYKKSPISSPKSRSFDGNGSLTLSEDRSFVSRESLYVSADIEDKAVAVPSFYSVSIDQLAPTCSQPQPNIHLISLDSHNGRGSGRSKSAAVGEEELTEDEFITDNSVGLESTSLDFLTTPFRSEDKKRLLTSDKKQLLEEGGTLTERFNPARTSLTPSAKEMSLLSFLNTKIRRDGFTPTMGSVHSADLDLTPSPPPPPPPLLMAPFSPVHLVQATEMSTPHAPEAVVTLCLPSSKPDLGNSSPLVVSNQYSNIGLSPTVSESDDTDADNLVPIGVPIQPPSEEKISTAIEMARSFCKEFQSIFTAASSAITEVGIGVGVTAVEGDTAVLETAIDDQGISTVGQGTAVVATVSIEASTSSSEEKEEVLSVPPSKLPEIDVPVKLAPDETDINTDANVSNL